MTPLFSIMQTLLFKRNKKQRKLCSYVPTEGHILFFLELWSTLRRLIYIVFSARFLMRACFSFCTKCKDESLPKSQRWSFCNLNTKHPECEDRNFGVFAIHIPNKWRRSGENFIGINFRVKTIFAIQQNCSCISRGLFSPAFNFADLI